jgi:hypothetical protein
VVDGEKQKQNGSGIILLSRPIDHKSKREEKKSSKKWVEESDVRPLMPKFEGTDDDTPPFRNREDSPKQIKKKLSVVPEREVVVGVDACSTPSPGKKSTQSHESRHRILDDVSVLERES